MSAVLEESARATGEPFTKLAGDKLRKSIVLRAEEGEAKPSSEEQAKPKARLKTDKQMSALKSDLDAAESALSDANVRFNKQLFPTSKAYSAVRIATEAFTQAKAAYTEAFNAREAAGANETAKPKVAKDTGIAEHGWATKAGEGWAKSIGLTAAEGKAAKEAVYNWSSGSYPFVRKVDAGEDDGDIMDEFGVSKAELKAYKAETESLNKLMDNAPKFPGEIYRGLTLPPDVLDEVVASGKMELGAMSSFSSDMKASQLFSAPNPDIEYEEPMASVLLRVKANKSGVSITDFSGAGEKESEVLVPKTAKYKVVGSSTQTRKSYNGEDYDETIIDLEEV